VTIQAQILELLQTIAAEMGMSVLLITHNFGVVAEICQRVSVMYGGKIMETGETRELLRDARHPYSRALIASIPTTQKRGGKLTTIPGAPPPPLAVPEACLFAPRCRYVLPECSAAYPAFRSCGDKGEHSFACLRGAEVRDLRPDGGEVAGHA
jgi:oligopeptide/dipeptide ABC transporter ATP-binding protein